MHLKVCPNPACGKVSDVGAAMCESCGQPFPKMTLVPADAAAAAEAGGTPASASQDTVPIRADKARMPAWPLVMVAVVAGGLPLLWANRAQLPTPKTWQVTLPDAGKPGAAAPASVAPTPPVAVNVAPTVPPAAAVAPAPTLAAVPDAEDAATPKSNADSADDSAKSQTQRPATGHTAKKVAKAPPPKKTEPSRACTEAVAALGLCDPKQAGK